MINNLPQYIEQTKLQIKNKKDQGGTRYVQLSIKFESPNMVENFKRYWTKEGYNFWFKTCTRGLTDYEISWKNEA